MERRPGGKKAWSVLEKMGKKAWCLFFLGLIHIKIKDKAKLTYYFNQLPFTPFDLKMFSGT